jgi:hypothetical protein
MNKTVPTAFAVLLLGTGLLAQSNQAPMGASPHKVKQGVEITFQVMVSPGSNVSGSVNVFMWRNSEYDALSLYCSVKRGIRRGPCCVLKVPRLGPCECRWPLP